MTADRLAARLGLRLLGPFATGMQQGAWKVVDAAGRPLVLKWNRGVDAARQAAVARAVEVLRGGGYPTPAWLTAGVTDDGLAYHVQEFAVGTPSTPLTVPKTRLLLEVLDRHAGAAPDVDRVADVRRTVLDPAGPRRELAALDPGLVDRFHNLLHEVEIPTGDLVHGDFNSINILLAEDRVRAVIDIEALAAGSRVYDYACLLRESYVEGYDSRVGELIRAAAEPIAGPAVLAWCAAATAFEIAGFKRRHQPDRVESTLTGLHRLAGDLAG